MTHFYVTGNYQWRSAKFASQVGDVIEVYVSPPHAPNLFYERTEAGLRGPVVAEQATADQAHQHDQHDQHEETTP